MEKICKCGHHKRHHLPMHGSGECMKRDCKCPQFRSTDKVPGTSKYCQDTPPSTYSPSPEPEPIQ